MLLLSSADFFKITFSKYAFRSPIRVSNSLDPNQDRHFVGPDLRPTCLQRLSPDDKTSSLAKKKVTRLLLNLTLVKIVSMTYYFSPAFGFHM